MMTIGSSSVRYVLLASLIFLLALLSIAGSSGAVVVASPTVINVIVTNVITNSTVANYLISNSTFMSFISNSPEVIGYFLNESTNMNATFSNPALSDVTLNGTYTVAFLLNPSFGTVLQNPSALSTLINATPSDITENPTLLECMLTNPGLGTLVYYPGGLQAVMLYANGPAGHTLSEITGNVNLYCDFLNNPGLAAMVSNTTDLLNFLGAASTSPLTSNTLAFGNLLINPSLPGMIDNDTFYTFLSSPSLGTLLTYPDFINLTSDPDFAGLATNPDAVGIISQDPQELTNLFSGGQFQMLTNTPTLMDSLILNPSLANVLTPQSETELGFILTNSMLTGPGEPFKNFVVLSGLLSNPDLPNVLNNPNGLICLLGVPALDNNASISVLLENPNVSGVLAGCPSAINTVFSNQTIEQGLSNPYTYTVLLESPNFGEILNNPNTFVSLFGPQYPGVSGILVSTSEFSAFVNNPSLGNVLTNPSDLATFTENPNLATIINNNYYMSSLLANPGFGSVFSEQSQMQGLLQNSQLAAIINDPIAFGNLMGDTSLGSALNNQGQLASFISDPAFQTNGIIINSSIFESMMGNPNLASLINNQSEFDSFYSNLAFSGIANSNVLLAGLLSNQNMTFILDNPGELQSLIVNPQMGIIFGNVTGYANFLANPGLTVIMNNPALLNNLEDILNNPANINFINSGSLQTLLKNPSLTNILGNPQILSNLESLISNPNFGAVYGNPSFGSILSTPQLGDLLSNPAFSSIFANPEADSLIANLGQSLIQGTLPTNFAGLPVPGFLKNPALNNLIVLFSSGGLLNSPGLSSFISSSGQLGSVGVAVLKAVTNIVGGITGIGASLPAGIIGTTDSFGSEYASNGAVTVDTDTGQVIYGAGNSAGGGISVGAVTSTLSSGLAVLSALNGFQSSTEGGTYLFTNQTIVQTNYTHSAGNGRIIQQVPTGQFAIPLSAGSQSPLIQSVLNFNNQAGQWLITCPVDPNPNNSLLYFTTSSNSFIGGNRCLANIAPLETAVTLETSVTWTAFTPAIAINYYTVINAGSGSLSDIAYSGETLIQGSPSYNISNGYSTQSYIFGQVSASPQQALWSWYAKYANFSSTNTIKLVYDSGNTFDNLVYQIPDFCQWNYNFYVHSAILTVNNINVSVPQFNNSAYFKANSWVSYGGYFFSPVKSIDLSEGDCGDQLANGISCGDWSPVGNGDVDISGRVYNGLGVFYGGSEYSSDPDADYADSLLAVLGNNGYEVNALAINYTSVNIVPYINYVLSMPTTYSQLSGTVSYYNQSFGVYNPHNYIDDPANFLDELTLYGNDGFFGDYNGTLQEFPLNATAVDNATPNSLLTHTPYFLSIFNLGTAKAIGFGGDDPVVLGHYVMGQIQNPAYIAASRNGYIYVINYSNTCSLLCSISSTTSSYLFTLKYIPEGYLNFSNYQPSDVPFATSAATWNSEWQGYYSNTLLGASQDLYIIEIDKLSASTVYTPSGWFATGKGGILNNFVPTAVQTDDNGDLFFLGASLHDGTFSMAGALPPGSNNWVENSAVTGPGSYVACANYELSQCKNVDDAQTQYFIPSSEFAVSPGGQFVYLANASQPGTIEVYSTYAAFNAVAPSTTTTSSSTSTTASSTTTTTISGVSTNGATCPNQVYSAQGGSSGANLSFGQAVACAQAAGFSGTQLEVIVSIAYAESYGFEPGATGGGTTGGCTAQGILQEGKCGSPGESYPLGNPTYNPSSCSTYGGSWSNIYYNPLCAFQWAAAYVAQSPSLGQKSPSPGCSQSVGDAPFCFWGTYWLPADGYPYCRYMPTTYSGYECAHGGGQAMRGKSWSSVGVGCANGAVDEQCTVCADGTLVVDEPHNVCPPNVQSGPGSSTSLYTVAAVTVNGFYFSGNIPLAYSSNAFAMNIVQYLADGGPYDDPAVANAYSGFNGINTPGQPTTFIGVPVGEMAAANNYDEPWYHHPVSITDSKGIIYVIDNWSFEVQDSSGNSYPSAILMLRAFGENGTEIPINPSMINTLLPTWCGSICASVVGGGTGVAAYGGANVPAGGWPPYGWPLSVNITLPGGNTVSYCALDCTHNAISSNTAYPAIGPRIEPFAGHVGANSNSIVITSDFNDTLYIVAHTSKWNTGTNNWYCFSLIDVGCSDSPGKPLYSELLVIRPELQNYTKLTYLDNASSICYLNVTAPPNSPCISNEATNALQYLYPPLLGVPNAFDYVESLGGPEEYLNVNNELSALFPTGVNSSKYQNEANSIVQNGLALGGSTYATLGSTQLTGTGSKLYIPKSYLKTSLNGYVLVPYKTVLQLDTAYHTTGSPQLLSPPTNPAALAVEEASCAAGEAAFNLLGGNTISNSFRYSVVPLQGGTNLNISIEGGDTYLKYIPQLNYYTQNLSDAGAIMYPYIDYQQFTNRLFGAVYVNRTVSPNTANYQADWRTGLPIIINSTKLYTYQQQSWVQVSSFGTQNAYNISIAVPSSQSGSNLPYGLGGLGGQGSYLTPNSSIKSQFTYNSYNATLFFQLFEQFKQSQHLASLILNLSNESTAFGYNRLVFTYVDRFNNTIYMPLDVDFANMTVLSLNSTTKINPNNENQTNVIVNGSASYFTFNGVKPLPKGSNIYLYWDANLNYYDTANDLSDPVGYFTNGLLCAIAPQYKCVLANPLSTITQQQSATVGATEANETDYNPEPGGGVGGITLQNSGTTNGFSGTCSAPPNSLLQQVVYNCNVFGKYGLSAVQEDPNEGSVASRSAGGSSSAYDYQYCIPYFVNGTGLFSSQLGLIKVVQTGQNGNFNYSFNACGVGQERVIAQYYGSAAPEPIIVNQTSLAYSGGQYETSNGIDSVDDINSIIVQSQEFNYSFAPNMSVTSFEIGSYALGFGAIGIVELSAAMALVAVLIGWQLLGKKQRGRK